MSNTVEQVAISLAQWRQRLARLLLRALSLIGFIPAIAGAYQAYVDGYYLQIPIRVSIYMGILVITFWNRISYKLQALVYMVLVGGFAIFNLLSFGLNADSAFFLLSIPLVAGLFFGDRAGNRTILAILLALSAIAWLFVNERLVVINRTPTRSADIEGWLVSAGVFLALSYGLVFAQGYLLEHLAISLNQSKKLATALEADRTGLENEITHRTQVAERARQEAETANYALRMQMWQVTGQAALSETMRGEQDVHTLAHRVIEHLCRYLNAQVGTLFVTAGGRLRLTGTYAYTPHPELPQEFRMGEGLVGQAASERVTLRVDDLKASPLIIASALGQSAPDELVVVPFSYEGEVCGVIEIGKLSAFTAAEIAFLEHCSESIAIAVNSVKTQDRIRGLLEETQRQAEVLQLQEEELRAANEELAALNAELQRKIRDAGYTSDIGGATQV
ncbi:MAG: GAF domain-containing protein [Anaerolineae bacterium]|nr:GAF domain-containing protein [Anaerolineae bacterium]